MAQFGFTRISSSPTLAKGSTYDGWKADALAAPSVCYDGTRYVLTCSAWNIANSQWASLFFTSSDLANSSAWSYVSGSLRSPATYILGNGSLAWFQGKYYFAYSDNTTFKMDHSTDLLAWTAATLPGSITGNDLGLNIGPTGNLELWSSASGTAYFYEFDGSGWTSHGAYLSSPAWAAVTEAHAFVYGGVRYLVADLFSDNAARMRSLFTSPGLNTTWNVQSTCLGPSTNAWEATQVFDGQMVGPFDRGDSRGPKFWLVYAGGDNASATDATDSSIGLAYMDLPPGVGPPPVGRVIMVSQAVAAGAYY